MNRLILLLIPLVALAANSQTISQTIRYGQTAAVPANPSQSWTASLQAETGKKYDEAIADAIAYQEAGGNPFLASERLGWLNYLKGNYTQAEQYYGVASRAIPTAINPLLGLLNTAEAQKDPQKIERAAGSLLHTEPSNYRAQMALGRMHLDARDYQRAASEFRRVLMYYPDDLDASSGLAWAVYYLGGKREALALFQRILTVNPQYAYAQRGVALASAQ
jgi:tetratricopeptide (TPR) repeat protein